MVRTASTRISKIQPLLARDRAETGFPSIGSLFASGLTTPNGTNELSDLGDRPAGAATPSVNTDGLLPEPRPEELLEHPRILEVDPMQL